MVGNLVNKDFIIGINFVLWKVFKYILVNLRYFEKFVFDLRFLIIIIWFLFRLKLLYSDCICFYSNIFL